MKYLFTLLLLLCFGWAEAQSIKTLEEVELKEQVKEGEAIIYGSFIQRLKFSSGGFAQDIRIQNLATQRTYTFNVKPTFKSARQNFFCYHVPAGDYVILNYWWTESKWYGGKVTTEQIFKDAAFSDLQKEMKEKGTVSRELQPYKFSVQPGSLNYLGTWHFDKEIVSFSNEKESTDNDLKSKYRNLEFQKAQTSLPD